MFVLITYDVSLKDETGPRRLRRVAKRLKDHGQRVQFSVFECVLDPARWARLKNALIEEIDPDLDSLRFYYLGANWKKRVEHVGVKKGLEHEEPLIL